MFQSGIFNRKTERKDEEVKISNDIYHSTINTIMNSSNGNFIVL